MQMQEHEVYGAAKSRYFDHRAVMHFYRDMKRKMSPRATPTANLFPRVIYVYKWRIRLKDCPINLFTRGSARRH
jgi:hypothetical protein